MENNNSLHFVMFPWLAIGHLIPFLHLSKSLAQRGHKVSFISTPRNLQRLPKIPQNLSHLIDLVSIHFPKVKNLPDDAESSMDIHHQKAQFLKIAFDLLESPLASFLERTNPKPDWIVFDYASHWLPRVAARFGISNAYFSLFSAASMAFIGPPSVTLNGEVVRSKPEDFAIVPKWIPFPSTICYHLHEVMKYVEGADGNESGTPDTIRFAFSIDACDIVLFRTCSEFEHEYFKLVSDFYRKPVIPLGFLPPVEEDDVSETWIRIRTWLDHYEINSVVYVALGTEATLNQKELKELAYGLERSGLPFVWVLRNPPGTTRDVLEMLPEGFENRVKSYGVIYKEWVPQVKILSHEAIGCFLTHCGWNSIIEGLSRGRVLVLFPVMNDQGLNARLLQEKKIGVEIARNGEDGSFNSESVAESLRLAMVSEEGELMREKARDMRGLFGDKSRNDGYVDSFLSYLMDRKVSQGIAKQISCD